MTNIRDLKYIVETNKQKNFTKAAKACFVSQPAMSMQIKKLEDFLGVQIFERDNSLVITTKIGQKIIEKSQEILLLYKEITEIAKSSQDKMAGDFKIGAFPTLASYYFPKITQKISKNFPKLKIFLVEEKTDKLLEMLENGEIDCAFLAMPIVKPNLSNKKIFCEPFYLGASKKNSLSKKKIISSKELQNKKLMLLDEGHCLRDQALDVCSIIGAAENEDFRASSLETLRQMVKMNAGITLFPEIAIRNDDDIAYIKIKNTPRRNIAIYWRKSYYRSELIDAISKICAKN